MLRRTSRISPPISVSRSPREQIRSPTELTFAIQGNNTAAIGPTGGGLGFGPDSLSASAPVPNLMNKSVAIKFDRLRQLRRRLEFYRHLHQRCFSVRAVCGLDRQRNRSAQRTCFQCPDQLRRHQPHDGHHRPTVNAAFMHTWPIDIPSVIGGNTGYVGFTGGTGGLAAIQDILNWTLSSSTSAPSEAAQRRR